MWCVWERVAALTAVKSRLREEGVCGCRSTQMRNSKPNGSRSFQVPQQTWSLLKHGIHPRTSTKGAKNHSLSLNVSNPSEEHLIFFPLGAISLHQIKEF